MSQKISQLPAVIAANISDTDILPIVATNITSKVTVADLRTKLGTQPPTGGRTVTDAFTYLTNNAVFNVKDYGATGDGVTDDTTAINLANTKAALVNGSVYFPMGTYKFISGLTVTRRWFGINARGTILKPTAAIATMAIDLQNDGYLEYMTLDGTSTTSKIGVSIGVASLQNILGMRNMFITGFLGAGARGIKIGQLVTGWFENLYVYNNAINLHTNGGNTPTDTIFVNCQFRTATTKGVWIETGYSILFVKPLFESNGEEGLYIQNTGGNAVEIRVVNAWFEGNWNSIALGAGRHVKYQFYCDGATGPTGTIRFTLRDAYFNGDAALTAKSMHITNATGYLIDGGTLTNESANVLVDGTSYGQFVNWQEQNGDFRTTVSAVVGSAWNSRTHIEDAEAAWTTYLPVYGGLGAMTFGTVTTTKARYKVIGKTMYVSLSVIGTTGGTASAAITITLPFNYGALDGNLYAPCLVSQDGGLTYTTGLIRPNTGAPGKMEVYLANLANWGLGAGRQVLVAFEFELS